MEKISQWYSKLKVWMPILIVTSTIGLAVQATYLYSLITEESDPLATDATWSFEIQYFIGGFINLIGFLVVLIQLMGFMLRSAQLIKVTSPTDLYGPPYWAVWGFIVPIASYFLPYRVLSSISNFAKNDAETNKMNRTLLLAYWIPFALSNFLTFRSFSALGDEQTYELLVSTTWLDVVAAALSLVSAIVMLRLIPALYKGIQKRMHETTLEVTDATS